MTTRPVLPRWQFANANGHPMAGGKLYFYETGTSTPKATYDDAGLTVPNANPVVLDAAGRSSDIFFEEGNYKVILKDASDNTIWTADPVTSGGFPQILPDGGTTTVGADVLIKRLIAVDICAYGASPDGSEAVNDAAIALAVTEANSSGGVLYASIRGTYNVNNNIAPIAGAAGIDLTGAILNCTNASQTGAFLTVGSLLSGGHQSKVLSGIRVKRATIPDWTDATQIGVLLICLQNTDGDIAEVDGFTYGVRCQAQYDGTTAADFVHNKIRLGRIWRCKHALNLHSESASAAGAPNHNTFIGGDITAQSGVNTATDRYGLSLTRASGGYANHNNNVWFGPSFQHARPATGTFAANAGTDELTIIGSGVAPVGSKLVLSTTGTLPGGLSAGIYYVVVSSGLVVKVSATLGGSAIDITDAGTGTHSISYQGATAYCVLNEVNATQNLITDGVRAEWTAPATMRGSLTMAGGGLNEMHVQFATSYLTNELTDVVDSAGTKASWRTENKRYSATAFAATRPVIVIPSLRETLFQDWRDGGVISYGFDSLHVAYTTAPAGGVGTATMAICALRNDQRSSLSPGQGIVPNTNSITIGAARGIGVFLDCAEAKWFYPVCTQEAGARTGLWALRAFDASGVLLGSSDVILCDHPSLTLSWNVTSLCWQPSAAQTDANQTGRACFRMPDSAKFAQVFLLYPGSDIANVQSFAIYTPDPYPVRAFHGIAGGTRELGGTATWDAASVASGAQTSTTVTVTGAYFRDDVRATLSLSQGLLGVHAYVEGSDTVRVLLTNLTGGAVDLASATVTARAMKQRV